MKQKAKNKAQQSNQVTTAKKSGLSLSSAWEMSAQDALRVNYLTYSRQF